MSARCTCIRGANRSAPLCVTAGTTMTIGVVAAHGRTRTVTINRALARGVASVVAAVAIAIAGAEAAGALTDASGFDQHLDAAPVTSVKRSLPNGKTDVIKAMGYTKWSKKFDFE
jgi:hypothetical protein